MKLNIISMACLFILLLNSSCNNEDDGSIPAPKLDYHFNFEAGNENWIGDFADYPNDPGVEELYQLEFSHSNLPTPLNTDDGALRQSGRNHSDDLFMFIKRKFTGLIPNQNYSVELEIEIASDAASGAAGIGGAPGESVYLKAGAASFEPAKTFDSYDNHFRMNIDKGNQSMDGNDMKSIGDFANGTSEFVYALKSLTLIPAFIARTNSNGEIWLIIGTDSGFEGTTTIYYNSIRVNLREP